MEAIMSPSFNSESQIVRTILSPQDCTRLHPALSEPIWVYHYAHAKHGWIFSVATHIQAGKMPGAAGSLSLGGFRIVPAERAAIPGFNPDKEAIELALGMEEKVFWSKLIGVGGPIGSKNLGRIVGGKCVLLVNDDARVGKKRDYEALNFAIDCLHDFETHSGVFVVTGQDLGHAKMSDGACSSLEFLNSKFRGAVLANTGAPTAEGNFWMLKGMLKALGLELAEARVGLIGVGNIGMHMLQRLNQNGAQIFALEANDKRRAEIRPSCSLTFNQNQIREFCAQKFNALVVNANGGTLNSETIEAICSNPEIKLINGCENLAMPNPSDETRLLRHAKVYCHTELCGMMGYLTAVEEYLCKLEKRPYNVESMFKAAEKLEEVGLRATKSVLESKFAKTFQDCVRSIYGH